MKQLMRERFLSMFLDDDDMPVMAREESADVSRNLDWEVLLDVQNLEAIPENVTETAMGLRGGCAGKSKGGEGNQIERWTMCALFA